MADDKEGGSKVDPPNGGSGSQIDPPQGLVLKKDTAKRGGRHPNFDLKRSGKGPKPGEVRNPAGRTRGVTLSEAYKTALAMSPSELAGLLRNPYKAPLNMAELIAAAITSEAAKGKITHAMELADRTEGKVAVRPNLGSELLGVLAQAYQDEAIASLPVGDDDDPIMSRSSVPSDAVPVHN